ncbi:hypothetical protein IRJ41_010682 [Triplophysa rosa]|uniref:Uncharacterized protein n=1 Tax=Triplophysa rosa TaxID=992332 RepID=A0A9W7TN70_TRIRA|nr:hypothetical protein IRJ41_010682 [Triplophysa rosa]
MQLIYKWLCVEGSQSPASDSTHITHPYGCNPRTYSALNSEANLSSTPMHSIASSSKVKLENNASLSISLPLSPGASFYSIRQRRALIAPAIFKACLWREKPVPSGLNDAWQPRGIQPTRRQWQRRRQKSSLPATGKAEGFLRLHVLRESGAVQRKIAFGPSFDNLGWCQARRRRGDPDCQKWLTGRNHPACWAHHALPLQLVSRCAPVCVGDSTRLGRFHTHTGLVYNDNRR